ncbi:MAG: FtsW/RodA/SpoVE family cell cycle protein, partial [Clostridiales bacterium]|nr:FtsW/RodA/SpoVE family cell cycle protein [Clostridiales bacterium]
MVHLVVQLSKYLMMLLFLVYTFLCFWVFRRGGDEERQRSLYNAQRALMFVIQFDAFLVLYLTTGSAQIIAMYLMQLVVLVVAITSYHLLYRDASELVLNNMCMLLAIGMMFLTRLDTSQALRQFLFVCVGLILALIIPLVISSGTYFRKLTWLYVVLGVGALAVVAIAGTTSYGAKLNISIGSFTVQPSEFVKLLFAMFLASMLYKSHDLKHLAITAVAAALFVLMLVISKDLGGALLYFFTFLVVIYVATGRFSYFGAGLAVMVVACLLGYKLFSHVQTRVIAWLDPLSVIDNEGYQVSQSLFAIGTGGWFGLGLGQGLPSKIPVVAKDFIFSAISEEMGGVFALCLIMVCLSCFLMMMNVAMQLRD